MSKNSWSQHANTQKHEENLRAWRSTGSFSNSNCTRMQQWSVQDSESIVTVDSKSRCANKLALSVGLFAPRVQKTHSRIAWESNLAAVEQFVKDKNRLPKRQNRNKKTNKKSKNKSYEACEHSLAVWLMHQKTAKLDQYQLELLDSLPGWNDKWEDKLTIVKDWLHKHKGIYPSLGFGE